MNLLVISISKIPDDVWKKARIKEKCSEEEEEPGIRFRMDVLWTYLPSVKSADGCFFMFRRICRIAFLVMTIPHSNAAEERIFNLIRANKAQLRIRGHSLQYNMIKMAEIGPEFKPSKELLEDAKKATWFYNQKHTKK